MASSSKRFLALVLAAVTVAVLLGLSPGIAQAATICVNGNGVADPGTGSCWGSPYKSLKTALAAANPGDEIWVAQGIYTPGLTVYDTFTMTSGVSLYGGFAGTEGARSERNLAANVTVLSGDIGGDDITDAHGMVTTPYNIVGDNAYHVLWLNGVTRRITDTTHVDGFVITAGFANGGTTASKAGGGLYCNGEGSGHECSPTVANVTFSGNTATFGGAMFNTGYDSGVSSPRLTNVTFTNNSCSFYAGAMYNMAVYYGTSSPTLTNVTFSNNSSANTAGAMYNYGTADGVSLPILTNVIFWGNTAAGGYPQIDDDFATSTVNYSLVQGGWDGAGANNIDADPLFADATAGNLDLLPGSAAIDAGTNTPAPVTDIRGLPRPVNLITDIGAYEVQGFDLTITGGNPQTTTVNTTFGAPLSVLVSSASDAVGPGGVLTFTPPADGPGLNVSTPFTIATDASGAASTPVTANAIAGSYQLTVTASGVAASVAFTLTNDPCATGHAYVNKAATGSNNGKSWLNAYTDLHNALQQAAICGTFNELWVAQGVYTPGVTVDDAFTLTSGIALYGGFAATETVITERNWLAHVTVLSGDIGGDDITDAHGIVTTTTNIVGNNAYHVLFVDGVTSPITDTTHLDGFVVTGGQANGADWINRQGGGLYCNGESAAHVCSPTIANVTFSGNSAFIYGGALYNDGFDGGASSPILTNVTFTGNRADEGGAIYNLGSAGVSSPSLTDVIFTDNSATSGGALFNFGGQSGVSNPSLTNVLFAGNSAFNGGAMNNDGNSGTNNPTLINVTFAGNSASNRGGAIYNYGQSGTTHPTLTNTILWGNTANDGNQIYNNYAGATLNYSLVEGGWYGPGDHNLDADPLFVDANAGNLQLLPGSPAIDAGTNAGAPLTDIRGRSRPVNFVTDMGAYEMQGFDLAMTGGNQQTTMAGSAFVTPLTLQVSSSHGEAVGGGMLIFAPPAHGPGLSTADPFPATADASGFFTVPVTANYIAGSYAVTVTAGGVVTPVIFTLTNDYIPATLTLTSSANPAKFGQSMTFTATVSPPAGGAPTPSGTVTFTVDAVEQAVVALDANGVASFVSDTLAVGQHPIAATYGGDASFTGSNDSLQQTVAKANTATTVTRRPNPSLFWQNVVFTATVAAVAPGAGLPTGVVTFTVDNVAMAVAPLDGNGVATFAANNLVAGQHTVVAAYGGDGNFKASSKQVSQTVDRTESNTTLEVGPNPALVDDIVAFTVTVARGPGAQSGVSDIPTGEVHVSDVSGTVDVTGTLINGMVVVYQSNLPAGSYQVTASYPGDANFETSTAPVVTLVVNKYGSATDLLSSSNPVFVGQALQFSVLVSELAPNGLNATGLAGPTGLVTVTDESGLITLSGQLEYGVAQFDAPWLPAGTYNLTAAYGGNDRYLPSTSNLLVQVVEQEHTAITLDVNPNPVVANDQLHLSATVVVTFPQLTAMNGVVTGTVDFLLDAVKVGSAPVNNHLASLTLPAPAAGVYTVTAVFTGNEVFVGSTSNAVELVVAKRSSVTALSAAPSPSRFGQTAVFTATVAELPIVAAAKAPAPPTPTGDVNFFADDVQFGQATLSDGVATLTYADLPVGEHSITAQYGGDAVFKASTSEPYTQVVQPLPMAVNDAAGTQQATPVTVAVLANDLDPAGGGLTISAITLQPAHGTAQVTGDGQAVLYTPDADFAGQDSFVYVAEDVNGNTDNALVTIVVTAKRQTDEPPQIAPVDPQVDSSEPFTSPNAHMDVQLPAGFFPQPLGEKDILFLSYTPVVTPTEQTQNPPTGLKFGNLEFDLTLFLNNEPQHGVQFVTPITVTIAYDPAILDAKMEESTLQLYSWDGSAWSTDGIVIVARDLEHHTLTVAISHLSNFGFFVAPKFVGYWYFPDVRRTWQAGSVEIEVVPVPQLPEEMAVEMANRMYLPLLQK